MPDTPFKSMSREVRPKSLLDLYKAQGDGEQCEGCGGRIFRGDWPFCRPSHPEDHAR